MQTQKEEIRDAILSAATAEFLRIGYQKTSMRRIAESAGITAGNIYAYFNNKESLLEAIVRPTLQQINALIASASRESAKDGTAVAQLAADITAVFLDNRRQFMILIEGSAGSRYENTREEIVACAADRIEEEMVLTLPEAMQSRILAETIAESSLSGIFYLFRTFDGKDEQALKQNLTDYLMLTISHMSGA